jgi:hypothetical protein
MVYQLGWTTLPGLRGLSCSEFRAIAVDAPGVDPGDRQAADERGVAIEFASDAERDEFLKQVEEHFAARRFTNAADAFDTVKAYVLELASKRS